MSSRLLITQLKNLQFSDSPYNQPFNLGAAHDVLSEQVQKVADQGQSAEISARAVAYLITLSALASTFGGIVRPICFAALRLITNSNLVGCSMGRSAGLAPFRILSILLSHVQHLYVLINSVNAALRIARWPLVFMPAGVVSRERVGRYSHTPSLVLLSCGTLYAYLLHEV